MRKLILLLWLLLLFAFSQAQEIGRFPFTSANVVAASPSYPAYLDNDSVKIWLVAESEYLTLVGTTADSVSQWDDKSIYDNHFTESTMTERPVFDTDSVYFDGGDELAKTLGAFDALQPFTVFALISVHTWANFDAIFRLDGANAYYGQSNSSPTARLNAGASLYDSNLTLNTWHVVTLVANGASSSIKIDSETATTGNPGTNRAGEVVFSDQRATMSMREFILVSDTVPSENQTEVQNYLDGKK